MDTPVGKIRSIHATPDGLRLTVSVDAVVACPRCAAGKGCGAGLLSGPEQIRVIEAQAAEHLSLAVGDTVRLRMAASDLLLAALIVYGLPLLGLLAGAALAYGLGLGDAAAAGVALGGAGLGVILGRRRLGRGKCLQNFVPQVEARL
jgi:sigma-E factor negative regulatory protein RseC